MALREKLTEKAQELLEPGEQVQAVVPGQKLSPWWLVTVVGAAFLQEYRVIVATDRRILVIRSSKVSYAALKEIMAEQPRETRIGPPTGSWWKCESLGVPLYVHKKFHGDVEAADALRPA